MGPDAKIVITILLGLFALATGGLGIAFFSAALELGASLSQALAWGPTPALVLLFFASAIAIFFTLKSGSGEGD